MRSSSTIFTIIVFVVILIVVVVWMGSDGNETGLEIGENEMLVVGTVTATTSGAPRTLSVQTGQAGLMTLTLTDATTVMSINEDEMSFGDITEGDRVLAIGRQGDNNVIRIGRIIVANPQSMRLITWTWPDAAVHG